MGLLSVKTAEERSKYIVDVYHYGIKCNQCQYDYEYYAMQDFISLCYTTTCNTPTVTNLDGEISCDSSIEYIPEAVCVPPERIIDCNVEYKTIKSVTIEDNTYITTRLAAGDILYFTISSLIVNGVEYLDLERTFQLSADNVTTQVIDGATVITNWINWLNSFNLPDIVFYPSGTNRMLIRFPVGTTFQITTKYNNSGDDVVYGAKISDSAIVGVQLTSGGVYSSPPIGGSGSMWDVEIETVDQGYLC